MPQNERLRVALINSGKSVSDLAEAAGVDPKTFERWITKGRTPHRVNAVRAAQALSEDVSYLWPDIERGRRQPGSHPDLIGVYATRAGAPPDAWRALFEQAETQIGILVYAAVFLHELWPDFNRLLRHKAANGCRVTVLLGDPDSDAVALRGREEAYGHGIEARCRQVLLHYAPLIGTEGIEIRQHGTTLYNSVYRGDDMMIVNAHRYGINAYATPVLHLRRATEGGLFDGYAESFEQVRRLSRLAFRPSAEE
jgi:transcriptional regulator with XRE-family HTH domain